MCVCTSSAELSWAVLGLYFCTRRKNNVLYACSTQGWRSSNSLFYSANQSAHIKAFFHELSFNWMVFGVAFPKLCNWFKRTNQSSNVLFLLSNHNRSLRGLHLFSNTWQQWRVFVPHPDWLIFFFQCAWEHYDLACSFYGSRWKTVLLVNRKQGDLF